MPTTLSRRLGHAIDRTMGVAHHALEEQVAEKLPLIRQVARAFIRRTPVIEFDDAVQVVSIAAWRILRACDGVGDVEDAIVFYGYSRLIDEVRSGRTGARKRGQYRPGDHPFALSLNELMAGDDGVPTEFVEMLEAPEDADGQELNERLVADGLAVLPDRLRLVVFLRFFEDLKLAEIGDMLGVTEGRISQLLAKALVLMRREVAA